jgi:hypothetical protein
MDKGSLLPICCRDRFGLSITLPGVRSPIARPYRFAASLSQVENLQR